MMETTVDLEKRHARALALEYRSRGYEVIEDPSQEQLPSFLTGYHPDLLLRKASEAVVVEVKSRGALAKEPEIRELARLVRTQTGWSFELMVVDKGEQLETPEDAHPFKREDILRGIEETERLLASGFAEAALLRAWSLAEATVRLLAEEEGLPVDSSHSSIHVQASRNEWGDFKRRLPLFDSKPEAPQRTDPRVYIV